jgi:hypothetical protein
MAQRPRSLLLSIAAIVIAVCGMVPAHTSAARSSRHVGRPTLQSLIRPHAHRFSQGGTALESSADDDEDDDGIADEDDAQLDVAPCPSTFAFLHDVVGVVFAPETFRSSSGYGHDTTSRGPPPYGRM